MKMTGTGSEPAFGGDFSQKEGDQAPVDDQFYQALAPFDSL